MVQGYVKKLWQNGRVISTDILNLVPGVSCSLLIEQACPNLEAM